MRRKRDHRQPVFRYRRFFDLGFEQAGLGPVVWQVEIDRDCRRVLKKHFPRCAVFEDIRECGAHNLAPVDIICGGFPCQDLSVAGKRAGLKGERSGLFYEMTRIVDELKPVYVVWENVPGLLNSEQGRDMYAVIAEMDRIGYHGAWRIIDAQFIGVAQRRRRCFGVFSRGDTGAECCAEILSLRAGMCGHPAPRRTAGKGIAADVIPSLTASGRGVGRAGDSRGQDPVIPEVAPAITSKMAKGTGGPSGDECQNVIVAPPVAFKVRCGREGGGKGYLGVIDIAMTLSTNGAGQYMACYENHGQDSRIKECGDLAPAINAKAGTGGNNLPLVAFRPNNSHKARSLGESEYVAPTLPSDESGNKPCVATSLMVRRLTPRECERLQGFPDDWTATGADGKPISDSARYRMLGNAVCVNVARWIGKRIKETT